MPRAQCGAAIVSDRDRRSGAPTNPLGIKTGGEGTAPRTGCLMLSAILDALLGEVGVRDLSCR